MERTFGSDLASATRGLAGSAGGPLDDVQLDHVPVVAMSLALVAVPTYDHRRTMASDFGVPTTVETLLASARDRLDRLTPEAARDLVDNGVVLIDIRSESQRHADGAIPDAVVVQRNVLEWRLDPDCPNCDPELAQRGRLVILICNEGYQSSLAAATLQRFGLDATDVIGGAQAWNAAGLPLERTYDARATRPDLVATSQELAMLDEE